MLQVFAHFLSLSNPSKTVVPVLNVARAELPLKTEVVHCLEKKLGLQMSDLICRDELSFDSFRKLEIVLVDHHALTGADVQFSDQVYFNIFPKTAIKASRWQCCFFQLQQPNQVNLKVFLYHSYSVEPLNCLPNLT